MLRRGKRGPGRDYTHLVPGSRDPGNLSPEPAQVPAAKARAQRAARLYGCR